MSEEPASWWPSDSLDRKRWGALVEPALKRLLSARDRNRLPHAVLMVGPPGLGRELAAVEAAALLTCQGMGARGEGAAAQIGYVTGSIPMSRRFCRRARNRSSRSIRFVRS